MSLQIGIGGTDSLRPFVPGQAQPAAGATPNAQSDLQAFFQLIGPLIQEPAMPGDPLPVAPNQIHPPTGITPDAQSALQAFLQLIRPLIHGEITPLPATSLQAQEFSGAPTDKAGDTGKTDMTKRERDSLEPETRQKSGDTAALLTVIAGIAPPLPAPVLLPWAFAAPSQRIADTPESAASPEVHENLKLPQIAVKQEPITFAALLTEQHPVVGGPIVTDKAVGELEAPTEPALPLGIHLVPDLKSQSPRIVRTIQTEKSTIGFVSQNAAAALQTAQESTVAPAIKEQNEPTTSDSAEATARRATPVTAITERTKRTQDEPVQVSGFQPLAPREVRVPSEAAPHPVSVQKPLPAEHAPLDQVKPVEPPAPVATVRNGPVREISLKLPDKNGGTVEVQIVERGGKVNVIVRSPDTNLSNTLREQLTELVRAVHEKGYDIETWTPPETRPHLGEKATFATDFMRGEGSSAGSGNPQNGGGQNGSNQQQKRQQQRPEWLLELERRLQKEG
jgi:hypothetical protein